MELRSPQILTAPSPRRLIEALAHEMSRENPSVESVAEHLRRYALEACARLVPPEQMIVSLKAIVTEAAPDVGLRERAELVAQLIPYALEGYFLDGWVRRTGRPLPLVMPARRPEAGQPAPD